MNLGNYQSTPVGQSLNRIAREIATTEIQRSGKSLPCTVVSVRGAIVQVSFQVQSAQTIPNVTIPIIGSEYFRAPIQPGCKGLTIAADAYLGGVSGLGGGVATLAQRGNLTALAFVPIGNTGFQAVDGNAATVYGPNGAVLRDSNSVVTFTLTPTGGIVMNLGGKPLSIENASGVSFTGIGSGGVTMTGVTLTITDGDVIADGISLKTHLTSGVQTGGGTSGPPVA